MLFGDDEGLWARIATPEAKEWLERALVGEFSDAVRAAAALSVADLVDQQRFLPYLRKIALGPSGRPGKSESLLAMTRIGDKESAGAIAEALPLWREPELFGRGLLYCAATLDRPLEEVVPQNRRDDVAEIWREVIDIEQRGAHRDLLRERIAADLTRARAHWLLARDDQRMATLREVLELDRELFPEQRGSDPGGGVAPPPPPSGGPPSDGGGEPPPPTDDPRPPEPPGGGALPGTGGRRTRYDPTRIEHDLRLWLVDYSPFDLADPFGR